MKLQTNYPLIGHVRSAKHFATPDSVILKCLIFAIIFLVTQTLEGIPLVAAAMPALLSKAQVMMETNGEVSSEEMMQQINVLLADPSLTLVMLYSTALCTLAVLFYCRVIQRRKLSTMGFFKKHALLQYLAGLLAGFAMFSLIVLLSVLFGGVTWNGYVGVSAGVLLPMCGGWLLQGMSEEVLCRGYFMTDVLRHKNVVWAVALNSVFFGLLHAFNNGFSVPAMVNLTLYAVMISLYVLRTNSLWGACALHSIWNAVQGNFYGLPVSGIDAGGTVFSCSLNDGHALINGGRFGLEAGLPCTIVLLLSIALLLLGPGSAVKAPAGTDTPDAPSAGEAA